MIRRYAPDDYEAVSRVCLLTGDAGRDATGLNDSDDLLPDSWARPYLAFDPSLAWVVDEGAGAEGYIIATADSRAFEQFYGNEWGRGVAHDPLIPEVDEYPAHLHIDLLPRLQGRGIGRELIDVLIADLRTRGIRGLHLRMDPRNRGAKAFYLRLGFTELGSGFPENPVVGTRLL
jgi:ribosomal protein S18 acetylase RimI-like enzyme